MAETEASRYHDAQCRLAGMELGLASGFKAEWVLGRRCHECGIWALRDTDQIQPDGELMFVCGYCGKDWVERVPFMPAEDY